MLPLFLSSVSSVHVLRAQVDVNFHSVSDSKMFPLGAAQLQALKTFVPSLATYGVAGGSLVVYIASEWKGKDLLQFVPIYNRSVRIETGSWAT